MTIFIKCGLKYPLELQTAWFKSQLFRNISLNFICIGPTINMFKRRFIFSLRLYYKIDKIE